MKLISFDTEDDGQGNCFLCTFCIIHNDNSVEYKVFHGRDWQAKCLHWLCELPNCYIYATNLEYDITNIFGLSTNLVTRFYNSSKLLYATYEGIEFRDTLWLSNPPISVKTMGEQMGIKKMEMPKQPFNKSKNDWIEYNKQDALITALWTLREIQKFGEIGIELKRTLPATALKAFMNKYEDNIMTPNRLTKTGLTYRDYIRKSYGGGRTEIFRTGVIDGNVHCADVNSMYPSVMLNNEYPNPAYAEFIVNKKQSPLHKEYMGVFHATVTVPKVFNPSLYFRHKSKTIFPTGILRGYWTGADLLYAESLGYEIIIHDAIIYTKSVKPFKEFVDYFYSLKVKGNKQAKYILNSLYGKFGESGELKIIGPDGEKTEHYTSQHSNVIWSAYVTSYARIQLHKFMSKVEDNNLLYCDTDSIFYRGKKVFDNSDMLGVMSHKGTETGFQAILPKLYRWGNNYHAKGVPQRDAMEFFLSGRTSYNKPLRFRESVRRGRGSGNNWINAEKKLQSSYDKREVIDKFGSTKPIHFVSETVSE